MIEKTFWNGISKDIRSIAAEEFPQIIKATQDNSDNKSASFFKAVHCLVPILGHDSRATDIPESKESVPGGEESVRSMPLRDTERGANIVFEARRNSYIEQGVINVEHDSGVREVFFVYDKQTLDTSTMSVQRVKRFATYVASQEEGVKTYNSFLTGQPETVTGPTEIEPKDMPSAKAIDLLVQMHDVYQQRQLELEQANEEYEDIGLEPPVFDSEDTILAAEASRPKTKDGAPKEITK